MGIRVFVFLDIEGFVFLFEFDGYQDICRSEVFICTLFGGIILFFDKAACKISYFINKTSGTVYSRDVLSVFITHQNSGDAILLTNPKVVCTIGWRSMYDTRTVLGRHKISRNYTKGFL